MTTSAGLMRRSAGLYSSYADEYFLLGLIAAHTTPGRDRTADGAKVKD